MTRTATPRRADRKVAVPAAATSPVPVNALGDQRFVIPDLSWEQYVAINDAVVEHPGVKMIYCDGRLTLLTNRAGTACIRNGYPISSLPWPNDSE